MSTEVYNEPGDSIWVTRFYGGAEKGTRWCVGSGQESIEVDEYDLLSLARFLDDEWAG